MQDLRKELLEITKQAREKQQTANLEQNSKCQHDLKTRIDKKVKELEEEMLLQAKRGKLFAEASIDLDLMTPVTRHFVDVGFTVHRHGDGWSHHTISVHWN